MVDLTWQNEENVDGVVDTDDSSNEDSLPTPCVSILLLKERARRARRARPGIDCDVIRDIREEERSGHIYIYIYREREKERWMMGEARKKRYRSLPPPWPAGRPAG